MKRLDSFSTYGSLKGGQIIFKNRRYFDGMLNFFQDEKEIRITIERVKDSVSQKQYGYLYGHLYEVLSAATGYSVDELDEVMKAKFLHAKRKWRGGELAVIRDKHSLSHEEMSDFIQEVYQECLDLGCKVEEPDKEWRVKRDFPEDFPKQ